MKKNVLLTAACIIFAAASLLIYSCKKNIFEQNSSLINKTQALSDPEFISSAKEWYTLKIKNPKRYSGIKLNTKAIILPDWKNAKRVDLEDGKSALIVPSSAIKFSDASKASIVRYFVFIQRNAQILDGKILEVFNKNNSLSGKENLIANFQNQKLDNFTGSVLSYDVFYNFRTSYVYSNGTKIKALSKVIRNIGGVPSSNPANNAEKNVTEKTFSSSPKTLDMTCNDVYWVTTYNNGTEDWEYLYTDCTNTGGNNEVGGGSGGGGGGGGTGGSGGSAGDSNGKNYGLDDPSKCLNCRVTDANFSQLISDVQAEGLEVTVVYKTTLYVDDVAFNGSVQEIYDSAGALVVTYFTPDQNSSKFQVGIHYSVGNQESNISVTPNGNYIRYGDLSFENPAGDLGSSSLYYTSPGAMGGYSTPAPPVESVSSSNTDDGSYSTTGTIDNSTYPTYQTSQPWPTVANVIPASSFVGWTNGSNCFVLSQQQIKKNGYGISQYGAAGQTIQVYTEAGGANATNATAAVSYLNYALGKGIPVVVGVDRVAGSPNTSDNSTDHFIVIVGSGSDAGGNFYRFYDNSTGNLWDGTSSRNKLYYNSTTHKFSGNTDSQYNNAATQAQFSTLHPYILTQVRKSKKIQ